MKPLFLLFILIASQKPLNAHHFYSSKECFKDEVSEQYIPGYRNYDGRWITGRVSVTKKKVVIPCNHQTRPQISSDPQCSSATGGLIGGGIAAAISEKDAYGWSIPLGAVLGMGINKERCQ